jgi:hypothetical protein
MVLSTDLPGIAISPEVREVIEPLMAARTHLIAWGREQLISSAAIQQLAVNFSPNTNATTVNISMTAGFNSPFGVRQEVRLTLANPEAHT